MRARFGGEGGKPLETDEALFGELVGGSRQLRRPGPSRHDHGYRQRGQPAADEPEEGERVRVGPMGVVERDQKWSHRHFAEPIQDGIEAIGRRLIAHPIAPHRTEHLQAEQVLQGLAEESKGQGRFGDVSPAGTHAHTFGGKLHRSVEDGRFAQPRLPQDEQGLALSGRGPVEDLLKAAQHAFSLGHRADRPRPPPTAQ